MIIRSAQRAETSLLTYSRQALPRPHRFYTTPSKKANAEAATAAAVASSPSTSSYDPSYSIPSTSSSTRRRLRDYLESPKKLVSFPSPLPSDVPTNAENDQMYIDSPTQERLALIKACLHNLFDVPRAIQLFRKLRAEGRHLTAFDTPTFNSMLEAYLHCHEQKVSPRGAELDGAASWMGAFVKLFEEMQSGTEVVSPNPTTYALVLQASLVASTQPEWHPNLNAMTIMDYAKQSGISVLSILDTGVFDSDEQLIEAVKALTLAATQTRDTAAVQVLSDYVQQMFAEDENYLDVGSTTLPDAEPTRSIPYIPTKLAPFNTPRKKESFNVLPEAVEQPQTIPFKLDNLRTAIKNLNTSRRLFKDDLVARQRLIEQSAYDTAEDGFKHSIEKMKKRNVNPALAMDELQFWMSKWHASLTEQIKKEIQTLEKHEMAKKSPATMYRVGTDGHISSFLNLLKPSALSLITIVEAMRLVDSGGVQDGMKTTRALVQIGRAVELEYNAKEFRKPSPYLSTTEFTESTKSFFSPEGLKTLQKRRQAQNVRIENSSSWTPEWTQAIRVKVGSLLVRALMDVAMITRWATDPTTGEAISQEQPAFSHSYEFIRGTKLGVIKLNPAVVEKMQMSTLNRKINPRHLPMIVPPKAWTGEESGGYLCYNMALMRYKESKEQKTYLTRAIHDNNLDLVMAGLNVLGSTAWNINRDIYEIVLKVWNSGVSFPKIPPAEYPEPEPERPDDVATDAAARSQYLQRYRLWAQQKAANFAERCTVNYQVEIANLFLNDTIYFPHNIDFRGRAYPLPPNLNHLGNDLCRGLLMFNKKKALGESGYRWLRIHLSNLYGYDKAPFDDRVKFVDDRLEEIFDSAENPLEGKRWWAGADDPWQCLACCMEVRNAIKSGDPHTYESGLPIHQDGTCNGLQHYAALGGDPEGAAQVNLSDSERPSDVYTYVANMVEEVAAKDAAEGHEIAKALSGKIARKIVKQTVMTTVYGVTFVGARDQIAKQLRDKQVVPDEVVWEASSYLAKAVLHCIGNLFQGAKSIQTYLTMCARLIPRGIHENRVSKAIELKQPTRRSPMSRKPKAATNRLKNEQMTSVIWTTPLGIPVVQPYRKVKRKQVMTTLQTVFISDPNQPSEVDTLKQSSAFPPNFIHSLDATHMMLTALECCQNDYTFAAVHDSYWTHACDIDAMSVIIRDTFVQLHSAQVLHRLDQEFRERYHQFMVPATAVRSPAFLKALLGTGLKFKITSELARECGLIVNADDEIVRCDGDIAIENMRPYLKIVGDGELPTENVNKPLIQSFGLALFPTNKKGVKFTAQKAAVESEVAKSSVEALEDQEAEIAALEDAAEEDSSTNADGSSRVDATTRLLANTFLRLSDLLPPLPARGSFEVDTIKKSKYFFS